MTSTADHETNERPHDFIRDIVAADVAAGRYEGFWERGLEPWDMAAGVVIVRVAGGLADALHEGGDLEGAREHLREARRLRTRLSCPPPLPVPDEDVAATPPPTPATLPRTVQPTNSVSPP